MSDKYILIQTDEITGLEYFFYDENGDLDEVLRAEELEEDTRDIDIEQVKQDFEKAHNCPVKIGVIRKCTSCSQYIHEEKGIHLFHEKKLKEIAYSNENGLCTQCKAKQLSKNSFVSKREAELYVLTEELGYTTVEASDVMGISKNNAYGKRGDIKKKIEKAEKTAELQI